MNRDGTMSKCAICESIFHWAKDCPDGGKPERVNVASREKEKSNERPGTSESPNLKADESVIAVTTKELSVFVPECFDSIVIDTACTSTVCGRKWLDKYVSSLEAGQQKEIVQNHSNVTFRFGDGRKIVSEESVIIPAKIGDTVCKIKTEIVQNDIPLLLSKESLKQANAVLDLKNDQAVLSGNEVKLKQTSPGHYCVTLKSACSNHGVYEVLITEEDQTNTEKRKIVEKLHEQFGHSNPEKLKSLLKDAGNPELSNMVDEICKNVKFV